MSERPQDRADDPWQPRDWASRPTSYQPQYPDPERLETVLQALGRLPQLVATRETQSLREQLAVIAAGGGSLLQGGDCAETFQSAEAADVAARRELLVGLADLLGRGTGAPVVLVGRIAGQYAKPRTSAMEVRGEERLPSYAGDLINRPEFEAEARRPDPELLLRGYERAALTLNALRQLEQDGEAVAPPSCPAVFREDPLQLQLASLHRRRAAGPDFLYTSHEALHLGFESAVTHRVGGAWYNGSTHLPWLGMRSAQPEGGHVRYLAGIANPIGVKLGPAMTPQQLLPILEQLDPERSAGRLVLIHRLGAATPAARLQELLAAVTRGGWRPVWSLDPMHGNTVSLEDGSKTRHLQDMLTELDRALEAHAAARTRLGGLHLELTPEAVQECSGGLGSRGPGRGPESSRRYRSRLDPRLNPDQALEFLLRFLERVAG